MPLDVNSSQFETNSFIINKSALIEPSAVLQKACQSDKMTVTSCNITSGLGVKDDVSFHNLILLEKNPDISQIKRNSIINYNVYKSTAEKVQIKSSEKSIKIYDKNYSKLNFTTDHNFKDEQLVSISGHDNSTLNGIFKVNTNIAPTSRSIYIEVEDQILYNGIGGECKHNADTSVCTIYTNEVHTFNKGDTVYITNHTNEFITGIPLVIIDVGSDLKSFDVLLDSNYTGGLGGYVYHSKYTHMYVNDGSLVFNSDVDNNVYSLSNDRRKYKVIDNNRRYIKSIRQFGTLNNAKLITSLIYKKMIAVSTSQKHNLVDGSLVIINLSDPTQYSTVNGLDKSLFENNIPYRISTTFENIYDFFEIEKEVVYNRKIQYIIDESQDQLSPPEESNNKGRVYQVEHGLSTDEYIQFSPFIVEMMDNIGIPSAPTNGPTTYTYTKFPSNELPLTTIFKIEVINGDEFYLKDIHNQQYELVKTKQISADFNNNRNYVLYSDVENLVQNAQDKNFIIDLTNYTNSRSNSTDDNVDIEYQHLNGDITVTLSSNHNHTDGTPVLISGVQSNENVIDGFIWDISNATNNSFVVHTNNSNISNISNEKGVVSFNESKHIIDNETPNHIYITSHEMQEIYSNVSIDRIFKLCMYDNTDGFKLYNNDETQLVISPPCGTYSDRLIEVVFHNGKMHVSGDTIKTINKPSKSIVKSTFVNDQFSQLISSTTFVKTSHSESNKFQYINAFTRGFDNISINSFFKKSDVIHNIDSINSNTLMIETENTIQLTTSDLISLHSKIGDNIVVSGYLTDLVDLNKLQFVYDTNVFTTIEAEYLNDPSALYYKINNEYTYDNNKGSYLYTTSNNILELYEPSGIIYQQTNSMTLVSASTYNETEYSATLDTNGSTQISLDSLAHGQCVSINNAYIDKICIPIVNVRTTGNPSSIYITVIKNGNTSAAIKSNKIYVEHNTSLVCEFNLDYPMYTSKSDIIEIIPFGSSDIKIHEVNRQFKNQNDTLLSFKYNVFNSGVASDVLYTQVNELDKKAYTTINSIMKVNINPYLISSSKQNESKTTTIFENKLAVSDSVNVSDLYLHDSRYNLSLVEMFDENGDDIHLNQTIFKNNDTDHLTYTHFEIKEPTKSIESVYVNTTSTGQYQLVVLSDNHGLFLGDKVSIHGVYLVERDTNLQYDLNQKIIVDPEGELSSIIDDNVFYIDLPVSVNKNSIIVQPNVYFTLHYRHELYADGEKIRSVNQSTYGNPTNVSLITTSTKEFVSDVNSIQYDHENRLITIVYPQNAYNSDYLSTRDIITIDNVYMFRELDADSTLSSITYSTRTLNTITKQITFEINDYNFNISTSMITIYNNSYVYDSNENVFGSIDSWVFDTLSGTSTLIVNFSYAVNDYATHFPKNGGSILYTNIKRTASDADTSNISLDMRITQVNVNNEDSTYSATCNYQYPNLDAYDVGVKFMTSSTTTYIEKYSNNDTFDIKVKGTTSPSELSFLSVDRKEYTFNGNIDKQMVLSVKTSDDTPLNDHISFDNLLSFKEANNSTQSVVFHKVSRSIISIGIKLKRKSTIQRESIPYIELYRIDTNNALITTMHCDQIRPDTQYTHFMCDRYNIKKDDVYVFKIVDSDMNYDIGYITNRETTGLEYSLYSDDDTLISEIHLLDFTNDMYILPNTITNSTTTSGSVNIWSIDGIDKAYTQFKHIYPTDTKNGTSISSDITGHTLCSGSPLYDEQLGSINVYTYDGEIWTTHTIENPDNIEILRTNDYTANINGNNITLQFDLGSITTANLVVDTIKELKFSLCDQSSNSPNIFINLPTVFSNCTVNPSLNLNHSLNDEYIVNDIQTNHHTFTLANVYVPYNTNTDITHFNSVGYLQVNFNNTDHHTFASTNDIQRRRHETVFEHGLKENDYILDTDNNKLYKIQNSGYNESTKHFEINSDNSILGLSYSKVETSDNNPSFTWVDKQNGYILSRDSNNNWTLNGTVGFKANSFGYAPVSGKYASFDNKSNQTSHIEISNNINAQFGSSVDVSGDGQYIIVGSPYYDNGRVYLYQKTSKIVLKTTFKSRSNSSGVEFGKRVLISTNGKFQVIQDTKYIHIYLNSIYVSSIDFDSDLYDNTIIMNNKTIVLSDKTNNLVYVYELDNLGYNSLQNILTHHTVENYLPVSDNKIPSYPSIRLSCRTPISSTQGDEIKLYQSSNISGYNENAFEFYIKSVSETSYTMNLSISRFDNNAYSFQTYSSNTCLSNNEYHDLKVSYDERDDKGYTTFYVDNSMIGETSLTLVGNGYDNSFSTSGFQNSPTVGSVVFSTPVINERIHETNFGNNVQINDKDDLMYISSDGYINTYIRNKLGEWSYLNSISCAPTSLISFNDKKSKIYIENGRKVQHI